MKVIVFDLDDTLYNEMDYVKSGFRAVAQYMGQTHKKSEVEIFQQMCAVLEKKGRGQVFDEVLRFYGLYSKIEVLRCLSSYRLHEPNINLFPDAEFVLEKLKEFPLYIVTDGNKVVQNKKLEALSLYEKVNKCYITHRYGKSKSKPSPYCFMKIADREKVEPKDIVYIGDNISKDFVGIKPLGFKTIQICRGSYKNLVRPSEYHADCRIDTLFELLDLIN